MEESNFPEYCQTCLPVPSNKLDRRDDLLNDNLEEKTVVEKQH
jgi:hypothetical protein